MSKRQNHMEVLLTRRWLVPTPEVLIQYIWGGPWEFALLPSSQMLMPMLLVLGPHFVNHCSTKKASDWSLRLRRPTRRHNCLHFVHLFCQLLGYIYLELFACTHLLPSKTKLYMTELNTNNAPKCIKPVGTVEFNSITPGVTGHSLAGSLGFLCPDRVTVGRWPFVCVHFYPVD